MGAEVLGCLQPYLNAEKPHELTGGGRSRSPRLVRTICVRSGPSTCVITLQAPREARLQTLADLPSRLAPRGFDYSGLGNGSTSPRSPGDIREVPSKMTPFSMTSVGVTMLPLSLPGALISTSDLAVMSPST